MEQRPDQTAHQTPYEKTLARAFRLLAAKPRSVAELRERLLEKVWADEAVADQVIARLQELGYLNDEQFAAGFARSKLVTKPLGRRRLQQDLQRKQVPGETARQALDEIYADNREEELIDQAIEKRTRVKGRPASREESKKLLDHLLRLGFSPALAWQKVREAGRVEDTDLPDQDMD